MDPAKLTNAAAAAGFAPFGAVDGKILPDQLVDIFDQGEQAHVPVLAGFNSGEIRSLTRARAARRRRAQADYEKTIRAATATSPTTSSSSIPASNMKESILATTRDALYGWTAERLVRKQAAIGQPAYLYLFDHGYPAEDAAGLHGFHASELPFVFGTFDATPPLWPKIPDTPRETGAVRRDDRLLDKLRAHRPAAGRRTRRTGRPMAQGGAYMHFADAPRAVDQPDARHVRAE